MPHSLKAFSDTYINPIQNGESQQLMKNDDRPSPPLLSLWSPAHQFRSQPVPDVALPHRAGTGRIRSTGTRPADGPERAFGRVPCRRSGFGARTRRNKAHLRNRWEADGHYWRALPQTESALAPEPRQILSAAGYQPSNAAAEENRASGSQRHARWVRTDAELCSTAESTHGNSQGRCNALAKGTYIGARHTRDRRLYTDVDSETELNSSALPHTENARISRHRRHSRALRRQCCGVRHGS